MAKDGLALLKHWQESVDSAICNTYKSFKADKNLFLSESDLCCCLYSDLRKLNPAESVYAVHSQVAHYAKYKDASKFRQRDLVLLNPSKLNNNNFNLRNHLDKVVREKNYSHFGETIFMEVKFKKHRNRKINTNDLSDLYEYRPANDGGSAEKLCYIIWGTKFEDELIFKELVEIMESELINYKNKKGALQGLELNKIFGVVLSPTDLVKMNFDNVELVKKSFINN